MPPPWVPPLADADPLAAVEESDGAETSPPFDDPGSPSHPASTGAPTPAKSDRATKDRRDAVNEPTQSESEKTEAIGAPW